MAEQNLTLSGSVERVALDAAFQIKIWETSAGGATPTREEFLRLLVQCRDALRFGKVAVKK